MAEGNAKMVSFVWHDLHFFSPELWKNNKEKYVYMGFILNGTTTTVMMTVILVIRTYIELILDLRFVSWYVPLQNTFFAWGYYLKWKIKILPFIARLKIFVNWDCSLTMYLVFQKNLISFAKRSLQFWTSLVFLWMIPISFLLNSIHVLNANSRRQYSC